LVLTRFKFVYGSATDWQNQHWVLPDYFRKLFYENHELFPSFAFNIGGGQNIYNFSYYGLFNPIIMLSYLFPFINMMDYMIFTSILNVIVSVILFYILLHKNAFSSQICFLVSFIFLTASPIIFHSHMHIMFVNYMPFLIMAMNGVDIFIEKKKSLFLIISLFLMIMTSYFFSVVGICVVVLYGIFKFIQKDEDMKFKPFFFFVIRLCVPILASVLMSAVLILPTFSAILVGRKGGDVAKSAFDFSMLIPNFNLQNLLYSPYSIGLTAVAMLAIVGGFFSKKKSRIVVSSLISLIFLLPIVIFFLNGALYLDSKVLIPFIPLICLLIAHFFDDLFRTGKVRRLVYVALIIVSAIGVYTCTSSYKLLFIPFLIDLIAILFAINYFCKTGKKAFIYSQIFVFCLASAMICNFQVPLLKSSDSKTAFSKSDQKLVDEVVQEDDGICRFSNEISRLSTVNYIYSAKYFQTTIYSSVYNKCYNHFYYDVFNNEISYRNSVVTNSTKDDLFNILMANKYLITKQTPPLGFSFVKSSGDTSIYKNDNAFPLGFATNKLMSLNHFDELDYPYSSEALLNYAVVDKKVSSDFSTNIKKTNIDISDVKSQNINYENKNNEYYLKAEKNATMDITLKNPIVDKILFIRFNMNNRDYTNDTYIVINGAKNKLTSMNSRYRSDNFVFDYAISSQEPIENLHIKFKDGVYKIDNIEAFTVEYDAIKDLKKDLDPFKVDMKKTKGDIISGQIDVKNNGYFVLTIPYDKGFHIKVDGENVNYEKVNKAFIGFEISKGLRNISIEYKSPLQNVGIIISCFGLFLALLILTIEKLNRKKSPENKA